MLGGRQPGAGQRDSLELPENEVHLWVADHRVRTDELERCSALLDAGERERASRFRFHKDFRRFVFGHARVRSILGLYAGVQPDSLRIDRRCGVCGSESHGKPFLVLSPGTRSAIRFSVSYSDRLVVVAVANGAEVGVDVERVVAGFAWREVAGTALSSGEQSRLAALDDESAVRAFYGIWTLKEAVSKASGEGLSRLTQMDTSGWAYGRDGAFEISEGVPERSWVGNALDVPGHEAAVAVEGPSAFECVVKERPEDLRSLEKGA